MRLFMLTGALLLGISGAFADPCMPGTLQDYIDLGATGCNAGLATVANFFLGPNQNFATPIPPTQVQVTPGGMALAPALLFTVNQPAAAQELFEIFFHLDVSAPQLGTATMILGSSSATGDGVAIASADICPNGLFLGVEPIGCPTSAESLITLVTADTVVPTDSRSFVGTSFFDVFVDLTADGGLAGTASLGSAAVQVTTVPEPGTGLLVLTICGALAFGRFRRHL